MRTTAGPFVGDVIQTTSEIRPSSSTPTGLRLSPLEPHQTGAGLSVRGLAPGRCPSGRCGNNAADFAVDYSDARPAPAAIEASGFMGVFRYLAAPGSPKAITVAETRGLREGKTTVTSTLWSRSRPNGQALLGAQQGEADANVALAQANALGLSQRLTDLRGPVGDFQPTIPSPDHFSHQGVPQTPSRLCAQHGPAGLGVPEGTPRPWCIDRARSGGVPWPLVAERPEQAPGSRATLCVSPQTPRYANKSNPGVPAIPGSGHDENAIHQPLALRRHAPYPSRNQ